MRVHAHTRCGDAQDAACARHASIGPPRPTSRVKGPSRRRQCDTWAVTVAKARLTSPSCALPPACVQVATVTEKLGPRPAPAGSPTPPPSCRPGRVKQSCAGLRGGGGGRGPPSERGAALTWAPRLPPPPWQPPWPAAPPRPPRAASQDRPPCPWPWPARPARWRAQRRARGSVGRGCSLDDAPPHNTQKGSSVVRRPVQQLEPGSAHSLVGSHLLLGRLLSRGVSLVASCHFLIAGGPDWARWPAKSNVPGAGA